TWPSTPQRYGPASTARSPWRRPMQATPRMARPRFRPPPRARPARRPGTPRSPRSARSPPPSTTPSHGPSPCSTASGSPSSPSPSRSRSSSRSDPSTGSATGHNGPVRGPAQGWRRRRAVPIFRLQARCRTIIPRTIMQGETMLSTSVRSPATPRRLRSWARRSLAAGLLAAGLAGRATDPGVSRGNATADDAFPEVLATIGNERITMADVRERFGAELDQLDIQYRRARHAAVENAVRHLVRERIFREEARKQGTTVDELILAAAQQPIDPTEEEIQAWYVANQTRLGGRSLDELRPQIREFLRNERLEAAVRSIE